MEILNEVTYKTKDGIEIMVEQKYSHIYRKGDRVWINSKNAPDGKYKIIEASNIEVKDGKILKVSLF